jgi:hypothetical protein
VRDFELLFHCSPFKPTNFLQELPSISIMEFVVFWKIRHIMVG